jgi:hypothetical protein
MDDTAHIQEKFYDACSCGNIKEVIKLIETKEEFDWNEGLRYACYKGHIDIVKLMISKGANDWEWGLVNTCYRGHCEIVNLMISKGANNWNVGLINACYIGFLWACGGGHIDIVNLMISKGANNWNRGLVNAYTNNHLDIVKLMILNGATDYTDILEEHFIELLYIGLPINKLSFHPLYDKYVNKINEHKKETLVTIQDYLINPIIGIINNYQLF